MFLTVEKMRARITELSPYRYRDARPIESWRFGLDAAGRVGTRPSEAVLDRTVRLGDVWKGRDLYAWMGAEPEIPQEWAGRKVVGRFDFGRTGAGNNSGFESLLYVDGQPYQGVDSNHQEVFLPAQRVGQTVTLFFRLWSGLEGGGARRDQEYRFQTAELAWLDEDADDLFYTSTAMLQTIVWLDDNDPDRVELINALDGALRIIDWSRAGADAFYDSVKGARERLNSCLNAAEKRHAVTVHGVGHTHIDVAWLWRLVHTREKSARSFTTVLRLMELYPEYVFLQTQPQLYDYIKTDYPDIYEGIKLRVQEGRWEAGGGMWLEADCNLTSGESLVRQILFGARFIAREFGRECTYLWLPDVFGYSWALPQILRKSGIHTFMTTKISWNQYNRMPHDTFVWRGMDGSEVLAHFITTPTPDGGDWLYTYNGQLTASTVAGSWVAYRDKRVNRDLLVSYGFGDGGGGVTRDMLEMRRRLDRMPGLPHVATGRADEYFERLRRTVAETDQYVHTWDGELHLEYHRGTYTSQAYNKRMNRKLELAYRETEWMSLLAEWSGPANAGFARASQRRLNEGWKIILRNQFHDIIPGSSIREVYEDSRLEYAEADAIAQGVWQQGVFAVTRDQTDAPAARDVPAGWQQGRDEPASQQPSAFTVCNSSGWARSGIVRVPVERALAPGRFVDAEGHALIAQRVDGEWNILTPAVPALGYATISFLRDADVNAPVETDAELERSPFSLREDGMTTPFYIIEWNESGQLTRVFDRQASREVLADGARGNVLQVFEDKPLAHDAWDIDLFYQEKMREIDTLLCMEAAASGPLCSIVRFAWRYGDSVVTQSMVAYAHSRRIDFVTHVDWQERQQLLKVAFPVRARSTEATFDVQFGNVKRPTHWNTSWDQARFETVGHKWADLSETGYGVSLANDCKYGYDIKDNVMRLSLLKSAIHPDFDADRGEHEFTYSLIPHVGGWLEGRTVQEAWDLNSPLRVEAGRAARDSLSLFAPSSGRVMVDAVKIAEDSDKVVLRLHEFAGGRETVNIGSDLAICAWQECDLLERPSGEVETGPFAFSIHPYEIKTFLIEVARK
ncbi:MAG: alpha-mannosidase [Bacilli bacterium]